MTVTKYVLDNGLIVLLREMHHAPVISFMMWYRVGSRDEQPGKTGISHWLEHMMFRGTPTFPSGVLDQAVSREGGYWNAFTSLDYTAYYETLPAQKIDLALRLEADRMTKLNLTEADVSLERTVILSERHMEENDPRFLLSEAVSQTAFRFHPYAHEVIGREADLRTICRKDLQDHYARYYVPGNAVAVAVGDFDASEMLARIRASFESIPAASPPPPIARPEPVPDEERVVDVHGPGDTAYLTVSYRAPEATHPDYNALLLLNAALAGGSGLGLGSGGSNKTSRLYRALVESEIAVSVHGGLMPTIDPYLYSVNVVVRDGRSLSEAEDALDAALARLSQEPVTTSDLEKAVRRARAQLVLATESMTGQAEMLGLAEMVAGDCHWFEETLERLSQITISDIDHVASQTLQKRYRTVGRYIPAGDEATEQTRDL